MLVLIQSSIGMSLSLSAIWSYSVKLIFLIGETEAAIFYWFSMTSQGLNLIMFSSAISSLSISCVAMGTSRPRERAVLVEGETIMAVPRRESRVYGAMGYHTQDMA